MTVYLLIHGINGFERKNFFPWLIRELESKGHKVLFPELPKQINPSVEEQVAFLQDNYSPKGSTIVLGHSLGATVALKLVEKLATPIERLILAAGVSKPFNPKYAQDFSWNFDFKKIKNNTKEISILRDTTDHRVPSDHAEFLSEALGVPITDFKAEGPHITAEKEPKILEVCLDSKL